MIGNLAYNRLDGNGGTDTAGINVDAADATVHSFNEGLVVTSSQGNDILLDIEQIRFFDQTRAVSSYLPTASILEYGASYGDLIRIFGQNELALMTHYARHGLTAGREVTFSGLDYIASYGDLIAAFGADAVLGARHYIGLGFAAGRETTFKRFGLYRVPCRPDDYLRCKCRFRCCSLYQ